MPAKKPAAASLSTDHIRETAYRLWLDAGCPDGQDTAHWLEAERLAAESAKPVKKTTPRKKAA